MPQAHSYPRELVSFIFDLWQDLKFSERMQKIGVDSSFQLPERSLLKHIISVCYQAGLRREEARPVMFRLIIRPAELFPVDLGPPVGFHPLKFSKPLPFNEHELYKLAPAADFYRTLVGLSIDQDEEPQIWGLVNSGTRWTSNIYGGRKISPSLPPCLVIHVTGPGQISVCLGPELIASLNGGQLDALSPTSSRHNGFQTAMFKCVTRRGQCTVRRALSHRNPGQSSMKILAEVLRSRRSAASLGSSVIPVMVECLSTCRWI